MLNERREHISNTARGADQHRRARVFFQLSPKAENLDVNRPVEYVLMHSGGLEQVLPGERFSGCIHECGKQGELTFRQVNRRSRRACQAAVPDDLAPTPWKRYQPRCRPRSDHDDADMRRRSTARPVPAILSRPTGPVTQSSAPSSRAMTRSISSASGRVMTITGTVDFARTVLSASNLPCRSSCRSRINKFGALIDRRRNPSWRHRVDVDSNP